MRNPYLKSLCWLSLAAFAIPLAFAQEATRDTPPPYWGVSSRMEGVFVTPVPNAPFSAVAELESARPLADGSVEVKKTWDVIARDSQGRIHNERRRMEPTSFHGDPSILSFHIYDPTTKLNTFLDPATLLARQSTHRAPAEYKPFAKGESSNDSAIREEDLGNQVMEDVAVHGTRQSRTVLGTASGTGKPVVVTDEYWYSEELHLIMLVKHDDPRTGRQTVKVTELNRAEPDALLFEIPAGYKVVDETPER